MISQFSNFGVDVEISIMVLRGVTVLHCYDHKQNIITFKFAHARERRRNNFILFPVIIYVTAEMLIAILFGKLQTDDGVRRLSLPLFP